MKQLIDKAEVLIEALPYMRRFYDKMPPTRAEDKNGWDAVRNKYLAAKRAGIV